MIHTKKIAITFLAGCLLLCSCKSSPKTGYVNLNMVFDKFPLKKQLQTKLENMQASRKAILDSLYVQVSAAGNSPEAEKVRELYLQDKKQFQLDDQRVSQDYNAQIWKQINQYVKDYGEEKGYQYIWGADGAGTLMYADKSVDLTDQVSDYVNNKFKGIKNASDK
jgi:outer membrane protein